MIENECRDQKAFSKVLEIWTNSWKLALNYIIDLQAKEYVQTSSNLEVSNLKQSILRSVYLQTSVPIIQVRNKMEFTAFEVVFTFQTISSLILTKAIQLYICICQLTVAIVVCSSEREHCLRRMEIRALFLGLF